MSNALIRGLHKIVEEIERRETLDEHPDLEEEEITQLRLFLAEPSLLSEVLEVFVKGDPELEESTCDCCAKKRELLKRLKTAGLV